MAKKQIEENNGTDQPSGFRLLLKALAANKVKRFTDDIAKRHGKSNITEEWLYDRMKKLLRAGNYVQCETCGMSMTWDGITIDHKVPRSFNKIYNGNIHNVDNLNLVCPSCNSLKGQKTLPQFLDVLRKRNEDIRELLSKYKTIAQPPVIAPLYPDIGLGLKLFGPDRSIKKLKQ